MTIGLSEGKIIEILKENGIVGGQQIGVEQLSRAIAKAIVANNEAIGKRVNQAPKDTFREIAKGLEKMGV